MIELLCLGVCKCMCSYDMVLCYKNAHKYGLH